MKRDKKKKKNKKKKKETSKGKKEKEERKKKRMKKNFPVPLYFYESRLMCVTFFNCIKFPQQLIILSDEGIKPLVDNSWISNSQLLVVTI